MIGGITFQPSELAKFAVLILGAKLLAKRTEKLGWIELLAVVGIGLVPAFLVIVEPDLGTGLNILLLLVGLILYRASPGRCSRPCWSPCPSFCPAPGLRSNPTRSSAS